MAQRVTMGTDVGPGLDRFPASIDGPFGFETCIYAEIMQHAVRLKLEQISFVALLRFKEWAIEQTHISQRKGFKRWRGRS